MNKTHRSIFIQEVKEAFPDLVSAINSEGGLLNLEMHAFHNFVQSKIAENDTKAVTKAFQIIEKHFENGNSALVNAIAVSFLEHLDLGVAKGNPSWALKVLPNSLRAPYEEIRKYHGL
ncbi:MAG: hypothetical protein PHQ60_08415 [Sideroxydans sp.]|nr:hypothetical protein [Sideroxydans sp.]